MKHLVAQRGLPRPQRRWMLRWMTKWMFAWSIGHRAKSKRPQVLLRKLIAARFGLAEMGPRAYKVEERARQRDVRETEERRWRASAWASWVTLYRRGDVYLSEAQAQAALRLTPDRLPPVPSFRRWPRPAPRRRVARRGRPRRYHGGLRWAWAFGPLPLFLERHQRRQRLWRLCAIRFGDGHANDAVLALLREADHLREELRLREEFARKYEARRDWEARIGDAYSVLDGRTPEQQIELLKTMYEHERAKRERFERRANGTALREAEEQMQRMRSEIERGHRAEAEIERYRADAAEQRKLYAAAKKVVEMQERGNEYIQLLLRELDTWVARTWAMERRLHPYPDNDIDFQPGWTRTAWRDRVDEMIYRYAGVEVHRPPPPPDHVPDTARIELLPGSSEENEK